MTHEMLAAKPPIGRWWKHRSPHCGSFTGFFLDLFPFFGSRYFSFCNFTFALARKPFVSAACRRTPTFEKLTVIQGIIPKSRYRTQRKRQSFRVNCRNCRATDR
jgi:hypothetical protein